MKIRKGFACVVAAVAAVQVVSTVNAVPLVWDANGADAPIGASGAGTWDKSSLNWYNELIASNVAWTDGNTAILGDLFAPGVAGVASYNIDLADHITVQDLRFGTAANGAIYTLTDTTGSLTVAGNIQKDSSHGSAQIFTFAPLTLTAGTHNFAMRDTPGDIAELVIDSEITGDASITINNNAFESWGTVAFNAGNSYTGSTEISKGRLVITTGDGLGSTSVGTTISDNGTLAFGGAGLNTFSAFTINEPITITRSVYTGDQYQNYAAAIQNNAQENTIAGPLLLDTSVARINAFGANVNTKLTISSNITEGASPAILSTGGYGTVELTGDNTGVTGGFQIRDGTLSVFNENNLGGPNSTIIMGNNGVGGGYLRINGGFMTDFGSHNVNFDSFSGGIDTPDPDQVFNIPQNLTGGQINKRGLGTLNLSGTNVMNGASFIDAGVVNIAAGSSTTVRGMRLRNGTLNIEAGATYTIVGAYSSIGLDSGESAVVNLNGGTLIAPGDDFNVSDNPGTSGTINIHDGSLLQVDGINFVGKSNNSVGTINQTGGEYHVRRTGNFALVLGSRRGIGIYNMSGGTLTVDGEFYVGQGNGGSVDRQGEGFFNQTGGTVIANNWFVVGREGAWGHVNLSNGAVFTKQGNGNVEIDVGRIDGVNNTTASDMTVDNATFNVNTGRLTISLGAETEGTLTVKNNGVVNIAQGFLVVSDGGGTLGSKGTLNIESGGQVNVNQGEAWIGTFGGSNAVVNIRSGGSLTVSNNWIGLGRDNGKGVINLEDGSLTKSGNNNFSIGWQPASDGRLIQTGGTFTVTGGQTWIGEGGTALIDTSAGTMNVLRLDVGHAGGGNASFNVSGTADVTVTDLVIGNAGTVTSTVNLSGGSLRANTISAGGGTGTRTFNFTGGTLTVGSYTGPGALANTGTGTLSPGGNAAGGTTSITGDYTQGADATLLINFDASEASDSVSVTGAATLAGTLDLTILNAYDPASLALHTILSAASVTGVFDTINGISISPDKSWAVTYTATAVEARATRPGDTNIDGTVDFVDLLALARNFGLDAGGTWSVGDVTGDGAVNFTDLLTVARHFNQSAPVVNEGILTADFANTWALALSLVPEPATLGVLAFAGVLASRRRRR